jgi:predicted nucleotidyltransferase
MKMDKLRNSTTKLGRRRSRVTKHQTRSGQGFSAQKLEKFDGLRDKILPVLLPYGVKRIALFGSVVRGEETSESDIDILVEFEEPRKKPPGLFKWVELEEELSKRLGRKVDMGSKLKPRIRPYVEKDMVIGYEKPQRGHSRPRKKRKET